MNGMKRKVFSSLIYLLGAVMHICAQQVVVDNGVIKRGVDTSNGHIVTSHYVLQANDMGFLNGGSNEFSFLVNGTLYSGRSEWTDIRSREDGDYYVEDFTPESVVVEGSHFV